MNRGHNNPSGSNVAFQHSRPGNGHTRQRQRKSKVGTMQTCDTCLRRKTKCDMTSQSSCSHCTKDDIRCSVTEHRRQRTLKNLSMIDRLETNIERMEACLQEIGFDFSEDAAALPSIEGHEETQEPPSSSVAMSENALAEDMALWNEVQSSIPEDLPCFYIPRCLADTPNAGFSALSPEGKKWINCKMGGESFDDLGSFLSLGFRHPGQEHSSVEGVYTNKVFYPLPPKHEIASLIDEYLQQFNTLCPLFQSSSLLSFSDDDNLNNIFDSPGRWASINIILAMGHMLSIKNRTISLRDYQKGWLYMKNALGVLNELCFGPPDLWTVQALLGMAIFFLGALRDRPCSYLVSSAVRICHRIRLERSGNGSGLCPEELEQRRRVFWIAYCLDKEISLRFGSPLAQSDDDMDVLLPMEVPMDSMGTMPTKDSRGVFNAFRACCELALIKSQLHKHLFSVAAAEKPLVEVASAVGMLDQKLQQWKESIPTEYRPETRAMPALPHSPIAMILLFLHLSYFNCLIAIHQLLAFRGRSLGMDLVAGNAVHILSNSVVFMSESLCTKAATASVNLMKYMRESSVGIIGIMIYYPIIASRMLSSSIIRNPHDVSRAYHMGLITQVEAFVSSLVLGTPNEGIQRLLKDCAEYRSVAEAAVRNAAHKDRV